MKRSLTIIEKITGFTLAEVLITLTIIGVIASLTIPSLIQNTQDAELKTTWKKEYGALEQTVRLAQMNDSTVFSGFNCSDGSGRNIYNALKNTMGYIKECNGNVFGNCWASSGVTPDSLVDPGCPHFNQDQQNISSAFVARDGTYWLLYSWNSTTGCPTMAIDLNGSRGPNQWGKDVLSVEVANNVITLGACNSAVAFRNAANYLKQ